MSILSASQVCFLTTRPRSLPATRWRASLQGSCFWRLGVVFPRRSRTRPPVGFGSCRAMCRSLVIQPRDRGGRTFARTVHHGESVRDSSRSTWTSRALRGSALGAGCALGQAGLTACWKAQTSESRSHNSPNRTLEACAPVSVERMPTISGLNWQRKWPHSYGQGSIFGGEPPAIARFWCDHDLVGYIYRPPI